MDEIIVRRQSEPAGVRRTSTAAGLAAAAAGPRLRRRRRPWSASRVKPVVIASANGHQFKNGGSQDLRRDRLRA